MATIMGMKRYYIPCAVDAVLSFIFLGTAAYTVFLALKIRLLPAAVLAGGLGFFVAIGVFAFSLKKRSGLALKDDGKKILATMDILNVCTVSEIAEIFERTFNNMHIQATVEDEHIRLNGGAVIIPAFLPSPITANQLKLIVSPFLEKEKSIAVLSSAFDKEAAKYAKSLPISLFSAKETFEFLRRYGALPEYKKDKKQGFFTELASNIFQRKNAVKLSPLTGERQGRAGSSFCPSCSALHSSMFPCFSTRSS